MHDMRLAVMSFFHENVADTRQAGRVGDVNTDLEIERKKKQSSPNPIPRLAQKSFTHTVSHLRMVRIATSEKKTPSPSEVIEYPRHVDRSRTALMPVAHTFFFVWSFATVTPRERRGNMR